MNTTGERLVFLKIVATAMLVFTVGAGTASATAVSGSGSVSAGVGLAVPAGYSIIPPDDTDSSDDKIVQLEQLTIQNISGSVPGTIYASHEVGGPCREYMDAAGNAARNAETSVRSKIYPCSLAPTILYQISVNKDTILLLKNRTRALITDFAVGDRINVYGFTDPGTSGVQALIIRNLDKPATQQYAQLEGLTVLTASGSAAPATFRAARKGTERCLMFANPSTNGIISPCPLGVDIATSAENLAGGASAELYRPFRQYYTIQVSKETNLVNANRRPIALADIQVGDVVNVYGRFAPSSKVVEAGIVRDLSIPRGGPVTGKASLVVYVSDNTIVCITTPCGQVNGATVSLWLIENGGPDKMPYVYTQTTVNGVAAFKGLNAGTYMVRVSGGGYAQVEQKETLRPGDNKMSFMVSKPDTKPQLRLISPNGGNVFERGSNVIVKWQADPSVSNNADIYIREWGCDMNLPPASGQICDSDSSREYVIARGVGSPDAIMCASANSASSGAETSPMPCGITDSGLFFYYWQSVPNGWQKILVPDGTYRMRVCYSGTSTCDWSDGAFRVTSATKTVPSITGYGPSEGSPGVQVSLRGSFAISGNYVYLGGYNVATDVVSLNDGSTLTFTLPGYVSPCPYDPFNPDKRNLACMALALQIAPGQYPLYVKNVNGTSNSVTFKVIAAPFDSASPKQ